MARARKSKVAVKDVIAIVISLLALGISAGVAWFTNIRQTDDVSVVIGGYPTAFRASPDHFVVAQSDTHLSFINLGTRPALILDVRLIIIEQLRTRKEDCRFDDVEGAHFFTTTMRPTVVKPNDVVTVDLQISGEWLALETGSSKQKKALEFRVQQGREGEERIPLEVCYEISFATPALVNGIAMFSMLKYHALVMTAGPAIDIKFREMDLSSIKPRSLVKETHSIFD